MSVQLAILLFRLVTGIVALLEQQKWYNDGKAAQIALDNAEAERRIAAARAAGAAVSPADQLHNDPNDRDIS